MTAPIPISSGKPVDIPSNQAQTQGQGHNHHPSTSSSINSSSPSRSPQTPFSPSFSISPPPAGNNSSILKWASTSFGSLGSPPINVPQNPLDHNHDHDHHHEMHDAFEFGDHGDMNRGSWTAHTRRAASMSNPSGTSAAGAGFGSSPTKTSGQGGISAMLSGFGGAGSVPPNNAIGVPVGSPPSVGGGVLAGNVAKGQGLLRRLSLGGAGRGRPQVSPTMPTQPQTSVPIPTPAQADSGMLAPEGMNGVPAQRGRRYSENPGAAGKKRGVSPMGERILRDHGHF